MEPKIVRVQSSTIAAAQLRVAVDRRLGRETPAAIRKIAEATRNPGAAAPAAG